MNSRKPAGTLRHSAGKSREQKIADSNKKMALEQSRMIARHHMNQLLDLYATRDYLRSPSADAGIFDNAMEMAEDDAKNIGVRRCPQQVTLDNGQTVFLRRNIDPILLGEKYTPQKDIPLDEQFYTNPNDRVFNPSYNRDLATEISHLDIEEIRREHLEMINAMIEHHSAQVKFAHISIGIMHR